MRVRAVAPNGDHQFGRSGIFLINTPQAVAQVVRSRFALWAGEWFLNTAEGTDYNAILGFGTQLTRDAEVQTRVLGTPGVTGIVAYDSNVDGRRFAVELNLNTQYGAAAVALES